VFLIDVFVCCAVTCESVQEGNTCFVVSGELTLYAEQSLASPAKDDVLESIEEGMNSGSFNDVQEDIVRVTYVQLGAESNSGTTGASTGETTDPEVSSPGMVRVGLFLAAGLLVALLVGVAYKQKRKTDLDENTELGDQTQVL
jgi:hypothetical protein